MAIKGFKSNALKRFFEKQDARKLQHRQLAKIERILMLLHGSRPVQDFRARPGFQLHALKGSDKGVWAVRVTGNRRIAFRVDEHGNAYDIDLVDYHWRGSKHDCWNK